MCCSKESLLLSRMVWSFVLALACLAGSGSVATAQPNAWPDLSKPHFVSLNGGRRLNIVCVGRGSPTVVFEQGGDGSMVNWRAVAPSVSVITRTCLYDRAGFGFSDPPGAPITGTLVTNDLHALLRAEGVTTPVVLVGHSIGGFYATLYTDRFQSDVAGLVLVEPGFAGQFNPPTPEERELEEGNINRGYAHLDDCAKLAKAGELSERDPHDCFAISPDLSAADAHYVLSMHTKPSWYEAESSQSRAYLPATEADSEDVLEERAAKRAWGDLPTIVLTAGIVSRDPGQTDSIHEEFVGRWKAGHDALAARSTDGESILVPGAHHFIQRDQPQVVIDAIARVVTEVRRRQR
jgi:pimeloyl-ACP methyl ester carboxylesterase